MGVELTTVLLRFLQGFLLKDGTSRDLGRIGLDQTDGGGGGATNDASGKSRRLALDALAGCSESPGRWQGRRTRWY